MGHFFSALALAASVSLAGIAPGENRANAATGRISIEVAGQKRSVTLIEFGRLKRAPRTTIIVLRSGGPRARGVSTDRRGSGIGLSPVVSAAGVVIAYPDAVDGRWSLGEGGADDAGFIKAIVGKLVADGIADKRRIFIAGVSTGGILALRLACDGADYLAGAAVMIANMPDKLAASCKPAKPMAFMLMNGTADPLMPFAGGKADLGSFKDNVVSSEATLAPFAAAAGCGTERAKQEMPDRDPNDGSRAVLERLSGCKTPVELMRIDGGGHTLPGRPVASDRGTAVGAQNNDISTPRVIWDFVRRATH